MQLASLNPPRVIRRGGTDAVPAPDVIAQATVELPANFGTTVLTDVSVGATLGRFASRDEALAGARLLAQTRPTVGIVFSDLTVENSQPYRAVELLVPGFGAVPREEIPGMTWAETPQVPLKLGRDEALTGRFVETLQALDQDVGDRLRLLTVVAARGAVQVEFGWSSTPRIGRVNVIES